MAHECGSASLSWYAERCTRNSRTCSTVARRCTNVDRDGPSCSAIARRARSTSADAGVMHDIALRDRAIHFRETARALELGHTCASLGERCEVVEQITQARSRQTPAPGFEIGHLPLHPIPAGRPAVLLDPPGRVH